jgi:hypothetical protein
MNRQIALSELEPLPGYTVSEVAGFNFVTDIDKTIKQYFTQVVHKFDESKGDIVTYYEINGYTATVALMQEIAVTMQEKKEPILASTLGVGGTQSMQMILSDPNIDDTKKKGILKVLFGLTDEQMSTIFTNQII